MEHGAAYRDRGEPFPLKQLLGNNRKKPMGIIDRALEEFGHCRVCRVDLRIRGLLLGTLMLGLMSAPRNLFASESFLEVHDGSILMNLYDDYGDLRTSTVLLRQTDPVHGYCGVTYCSRTRTTYSIKPVGVENTIASFADGKEKILFRITGLIAGLSPDCENEQLAVLVAGQDTDTLIILDADGGIKSSAALNPGMAYSISKNPWVSQTEILLNKSRDGGHDILLLDIASGKLRFLAEGVYPIFQANEGRTFLYISESWAIVRQHLDSDKHSIIFTPPSGTRLALLQATQKGNAPAIVFKQIWKENNRYHSKFTVLGNGEAMSPVGIADTIDYVYCAQ